MREAKSLPCFVCNSPLRDVIEGGGNQPMYGLEFVTAGHYGSTVFDPMDGTRLIINVCDECLKAHMKSRAKVIQKARVGEKLND